MNTRFLTWTVVAICSTGVAACGSDSPSIPTAPTLSTLPPAPPLPPARSLAVDLTGTYALPFEVGQACEQVPKELRIRTYEARIEYKSSYGSTDSFLASLSGATFHNQLPVWIDVTHGASGHSVWMDLAPSDNVILEEPGRGTYLMVAGWDGMAWLTYNRPTCRRFQRPSLVTSTTGSPRPKSGHRISARSMR